MGQVWTLARITYRDAARVPIYYIVTCVFALLIFVSQHITLFSFEEEDELRMIREMGISSIVVAGLILVIFLSASVVTDEIENRTALTLLAKPLGRKEFILGKFFGMGMAILGVVILLGLVLLMTLWMDEGLHELDELYSEGARPSPYAFAWEYLTDEMLPVYAGIFLAYVELLLLASFSLTVATCFPLVVNATLTLVLFCVGNLSNHLYGVLSGSDVFFLFRWLGEALYIVVPNLGHFNVTSAVSRGVCLPLALVALSTAYAAVVAAALLFLGRLVLEKREL